MSTERLQRYKKGLWAERLAMMYLWSKGYKILRNRYKCGYGEIDIVAEKDDSLVFVEVKARNTLNDALESVLPGARRRIETAASIFAQDHPQFQNHGWRFDVIAVYGIFSLHHLDNAWQADT